VNKTRQDKSWINSFVIFLESRDAVSFLATIATEKEWVQTVTVIFILALLAIGGAAYTDRLFTSEPAVEQGTD
jgi:hypothetical protein